MPNKTLNEWLIELEKIHPLAMDFKLERIKKVYQALNVTPIAPFIITVAGTNGKGSTTNTIAAICEAAGTSYGLYTSPHMHRFNERIVINGHEATDDEIIEAFEAIQTARGDITLTYFEFATLAAFYLFKKHHVAIAILEVGLGGRLDATNIVDANVAVITPIDLDHTNLLGNTITEIAHEKAGIIKDHSIVITAESAPNVSILNQAAKQHATLIEAGRDFHYAAIHDHAWQYRLKTHTFTLPMPRLQGMHQLQNAAAAISALLHSPMADQLTESVIAKGLQNTRLQGRFQKVVHQHREFYFDVTHNPQGAAILHALLAPFKAHNRPVIAVLGMLKDKDAANLAHALKDDIDTWVLAGLEGDRGQSSEALKARIAPILSETTNIHTAHSVADACQMATEIQQNDAIILVFGSFHTVSEGLNWINPR
ncbi:bifunctional tetrahydrofolate synthase/dihydrofolate synthase [Wohlfahrtiimonas chitiniclastica]|uniref:Dihydrofolate synthase/folylpolyglutamate synthase n=1 Tax=Wohlfahrtiimonas chitiniclastica TaxID=400946 RepID=A0AB35BZ06_9GAMM|nr:bifunctional tetrahydrofolate synthase/dihydrofolate synthase [Wohlfahrtiimonas chitiniclastica]MBS7824964.1 bifunctional tetrahydrofolate synthase/dihydrofolate synthase [Wohlfahrtiimonas chitiniclastica]MBS7840573.1 bifunctional tetrahydrofolate synthase/dihydrofolate synthase [Wohlfahrtiimonas chitiniclastica]